MASVDAYVQAIPRPDAPGAGFAVRCRLAGGFRRLVALPCLLALTSLLFAGCASLPKEVQRTPSVAFQDHEGTALGRRIAKDAATRPGQSGFSLMRYGHQAFTARSRSPTSRRRASTSSTTSGRRTRPAASSPSASSARRSGGCGYAC